MFKIGSLEKLMHELNRLPGVGPKTAQRLAYHILRTPDFSEKLQSALQQVQENVHLCAQCFSYTDEEFLCRFCNDVHRRDDILCIVEEPSDILRIESSGVFRGRYHVLHGAISPLDNIGPQNLRISELLERIECGLEEKPAPYLSKQVNSGSTVDRHTGEVTSNEPSHESSLGSSRRASGQSSSQPYGRFSGETDDQFSQALSGGGSTESTSAVQEMMTKPAPKISEIILALDPDLEGDTTVLYLAKVLGNKQVKITRIASGVPLGSDIDYVDDRTLGRALENRVEL